MDNDAVMDTILGLLDYMDVHVEGLTLAERAVAYEGLTDICIRRMENVTASLRDSASPTNG